MRAIARLKLAMHQSRFTLEKHLYQTIHLPRFDSCELTLKMFKKLDIRPPHQKPEHIFGKRVNRIFGNNIESLVR